LGEARRGPLPMPLGRVRRLVTAAGQTPNTKQSLRV
jgi:hypothetical protein